MLGFEEGAGKLEFEWFDEATGRIDAEAFELFIERSRLDVLGYVPGPVVSARTLRVEQQKRKPRRTLVRFVLDCDGGGSEALGYLTSVDADVFEARSEINAPVVYRSTNPEHRMLYGSEDYQFDDIDGTRSISPAEIQSLVHAPRHAPCWAPFTREAHYDDSRPACGAYSLLIERVGRTFVQELHYFRARGHDDAIAVSWALGRDESALDESHETRRLLYFTGFSGPWNGQVVFEHSVDQAREPIG